MPEHRVKKSDDSDRFPVAFQQMSLYTWSGRKTGYGWQSILFHFWPGYWLRRARSAAPTSERRAPWRAPEPHDYWHVKGRSIMARKNTDPIDKKAVESKDTAAPAEQAKAPAEKKTASAAKKPASAAKKPASAAKKAAESAAPASEKAAPAEEKAAPPRRSPPRRRNPPQRRQHLLRKNPLRKRRRPKRPRPSSKTWPP